MLTQNNSRKDSSSDERHCGNNSHAVGSERGDEDEQHAAWHERLGAGVRPESEGVGEQYGCRNAERRKYVPAGKEGNWRYRCPELLAD